MEREWLINPLFGTSDATARLYDRLMFHGASYADLMAKGLPEISVDATDIAGGISFPFIQPSLTIPDADVDTLVAEGKALVQQDKTLRDLLSELAAR